LTDEDDDPHWGWLAFGFLLGFVVGLVAAAGLVWWAIRITTEGP
jgi:hypothetical protein